MSHFLRSLIIIIVVFAATITISAQPKINGLGIGLILGEPSGITFKGSLRDGNAWVLSVGSSWFGALTIQADYLWSANVFNSSNAGLYFGLGGVVGIGRGKGIIVKNQEGKWYYYDQENTTAIGLRGVAGFNTTPFTAPIELFIEFDPIVGLIPSTGIGFMGAIGVRYYL